MSRSMLVLLVLLSLSFVSVSAAESTTESTPEATPQDVSNLSTPVVDLDVNEAPVSWRDAVPSLDWFDETSAKICPYERCPLGCQRNTDILGFEDTGLQQCGLAGGSTLTCPSGETVHATIGNCEGGHQCIGEGWAANFLCD